MYRFLWLILLAIGMASCSDKAADQVAKSVVAAPKKARIENPEYIDSSIQTWQQNGVKVFFRKNSEPITLKLQFSAGSAYGKAPAVAALSLEMLAIAADLKINTATIQSQISREFAYLTLQNTKDKTHLLDNVSALADVINDPPLDQSNLAKLQQQSQPLDVIGTLAYNGKFARELEGGQARNAVLRLQIRRFIALYFHQNNLKIVLTGNLDKTEGEQLVKVFLAKLKTGIKAPKLSPQFASVHAPAKAIGSDKAKILLAARAEALNLTELGALYYLGQLFALNNQNFALEQQGMNILYGFQMQKTDQNPIDKTQINHYLAQVLGMALKELKAPVRDAQFWQQAMQFAAQNNWNLQQLRAFYSGFHFDAMALAKLWQRYLSVWRVQQVGL